MNGKHTGKDEHNIKVRNHPNTNISKSAMNQQSQYSQWKENTNASIGNALEIK